MGDLEHIRPSPPTTIFRVSSTPTPCRGMHPGRSSNTRGVDPSGRHMNRFLGPASLAVSLLALAVAFWSPRGGDEAPAAPPPASPAPASASQAVKDLELRVKMLEDNALSLSRRLMLLEQRPTVAGAGGDAAVPAGLATEVEQLRSEVRSMVAGEALQSEGGREYLKGVMRSVQDEMR